MTVCCLYFMCVCLLCDSKVNKHARAFLNARNYFNTRLVDVIDFCARCHWCVSYSKVRCNLIEALLFTFYMNVNVKQCERHSAMLTHDMLSTAVLNKYLKYHVVFQAPRTTELSARGEMYALGDRHKRIDLTRWKEHNFCRCCFF